LRANSRAALERLGLLRKDMRIIYCTEVSQPEIDAITTRDAVVTLSLYTAMVIGYGVPPLRSSVDSGCTGLVGRLGATLRDREFAGAGESSAKPLQRTPRTRSGSSPSRRRGRSALPTVLRRLSPASGRT